MMSDCTSMFSNTSFALSTCFPHIAQSTRTTQQINNCFTRNRSTNLKKLTRRRMIKSLRFERKITLLGATTLKIAKKYIIQTMCWLRNQQIRPNQHVVQIGSHPRWFIRNRLQLGITLNNESIFLNYTINVFCQRGIPNKAIKTLLFTCRSLNQEILLGRISKTCGGLDSSLYALCLTLSAKISACCW